MDLINKIIEQNKTWAQNKIKVNPSFFDDLAHIQTPDFLWIGCSDSRVPANQITGTEPGEVFVHRNIANVIDINDENMMSVVIYAIKYLNIKHIIVCGHYGCGGINAALSTESFGELDGWLLRIKNIAENHKIELDAITDQVMKARKLVEYNVFDGVKQLAKVPLIIENNVQIHGLAYDIHDGILNKLT